jgi:hypothetical protein
VECRRRPRLHEFLFDAAAADIPTTNVLCCPKKKKKMKNHREETAPILADRHEDHGRICVAQVFGCQERERVRVRVRVRNNNDSKGYDVLPGVYSVRLCREFRDCDDGVVDQGVDDEFQSSKKPQYSPTH